eukprot:362799-Chlamydomonas_euryale.AAC.2
MPAAAPPAVAAASLSSVSNFDCHLWSGKLSAPAPMPPAKPGSRSAATPLSDIAGRPQPGTPPRGDGRRWAPVRAGSSGIRGAAAVAASAGGLTWSPEPSHDAARAAAAAAAVPC